MATLTSLKQLHYLVALSEYLNFTRAAEACFVTQSSLSAGLKELENTLGVQLVERDRQTVLMTPVGSEVVRRARGILAAAQDLVEFADGAGEPMSGALRIGVIPTIAPFLLPAVLRLLNSRYPALRTILREDLTPGLLLRLEEGRLDFALIALPFDTGKLLIEPLFDDPLWLVAKAGDALLSPPAVQLDTELSERLLLLEEGHCLRDHSLHACPLGSRRGGEALEATSLLTLVQMVESGLGVALIPQMAVAAGLARSAGLTTRSLAPPAPSRTIALVARASTPRLAEFKALVTVVREAQRNLAAD